MLRHGLAPEAWRRRHAAGEVGAETPYGYHHAESAVDLLWSADHPESRLAACWRAAVKHVLGFDLVHIWRNRSLLREADAVWTHTEREHLAVAALQALAPRRYRARSIAQTVWLWDEWASLGAARRRLYAALLGRHEVELVLSRVNLRASRTAVPDRIVHRVPFGTQFARGAMPGEELPQPPRVLVIGNDRHRDWALMAQVAGLLPDAHFDVVSLSDRAGAVPWPANATIRRVSQAELISQTYRDATVVAIPLRANLHASGCTVAIEAISAGVPVVATDVGGIDEYVADASGSLVPAGDADAFAEAVRSHVREHRGDGGIAAARGLSDEAYVARLVMITQCVLEGRAIDPRVERFEEMPPAGDRIPEATSAKAER
jgi:glycosyltransferase involved in cell wall biosynthesis